LSSPKLTAAVSDEDSFLASMATIITAKEIMKPTKKFVELQDYDRARTNIQYM
jgi:hypothetical protein